MDRLITIGVIFSFILGTLLHFTYEIFNRNKFIGYFSATNESIWEHIKLSIFPIFIFMIILISFNYKNINNPFFALGISLLFSLIIVPTLFYSYTYFTKKSIFLIDILIFVIAVVLPFLLIKYIINLPKFFIIFELIGILLTVSILFMFFYFTYHPPKHKIFIPFNYLKKKS